MSAAMRMEVFDDNQEKLQTIQPRVQASSNWKSYKYTAGFRRKLPLALAMSMEEEESIPLLSPAARFNLTSYLTTEFLCVLLE
jgi:hypothetical protein